METDLKNLPKLLVQHFDEARGIANKRIGEIGLSILSTIFKTEGSSHGASWAQLSEAYKKQKVSAGYSEKILHKTTTLKNSFGYESNSEKVIIGTSVFYAPYLEEGYMKIERSMTPRKFMYPTSLDIILNGIPGQEMISAWEAINS